MATRVRGRHLDVRGTPVEVVRKDIKNLHVGVYPPNGRVRVAAPLHLDQDAVRLAVISRLGWIRREQAKFEQQERQSQREFVTGESHYFEGRRYLLDVTKSDSPPAVRLLNNTTIELALARCRPGQARGGTSSMVPSPAPQPIASASRKMGAEGRCAGRRGPHQEDEDSLGNVQQRSSPDLAES